jgi:hypothetical protein
MYSSSRWPVTPASSRTGPFLTWNPKTCTVCCLPPVRVSIVAVKAGGRRVGAVWTLHNEPPLRVGSAGVPLPELCIAVVPDMRGRGVGSALLDVLFVECAGAQTALCLNVHVRNPARKLYQRKGSRIVARAGALWAVSEAAAILQRKQRRRRLGSTQKGGAPAQPHHLFALPCPSCVSAASVQKMFAASGVKSTNLSPGQPLAQLSRFWQLTCSDLMS